MLTNTNGESSWFTICKAPLIFSSTTSFYGSVHTHIIVDAGVAVRSRVFLGEGNYLTKSSNFHC
jgi:hypothetical protein